jgi:hypothetical protein
MRASSLSDKTVVELLSKYFIPVWLSTDDHDLVPKEKAEAEEYVRYRKLAHAQGMSASTVQVYVILPNGDLRTTLHVAKAMQADNLRRLLQQTVADLKLEPRAAIPRAADVRPRAKPRDKDKTEFHIVARYLGPRATSGLAHNWVELDAAECANFVPRDVKKDFAWEVPAATANKLYANFFPPGPNYQAGNGKVEESSLTARVAAVEEGRALVLLRGRLLLQHRIGGKETDGEVRARVSGYALIDVKSRKLTELALITDDADFVWHWQGQAQPSKFTAFVEYDAQ